MALILPAVLALLVAGPALSAAPPPLPAAAALPASLTAGRLQGLLQEFVTAGYGRRFRHLGDERDFDHGHVLLDARTRAPIAILYHTQELAYGAAAADFGYVDPAGRNWIQWLDGRGIENARRYERTAYPRGASWDWFVATDLPRLRGRRTITDKMLDPDRLGAPLGDSVQWTFTRVDCAGAGSGVIRVSLPDATLVCLALGT